jgi:hypothetical protein
MFCFIGLLLAACCLLLAACCLLLADWFLLDVAEWIAGSPVGCWLAGS